jgi:uncharacterized protein (DUF58 family)
MAELRRIELRTRRSIDADLMGQYRSAFRGTGLVFSDIRQYQPGDDVKHIHWKVTARSPNVYVKSYEEDRQLNIILALDISRSTQFGADKSKHQKALEFSALVALLAKSNQDAIGLCLFSDDVEEFLPARKNRSQIQRILLELMRPRELKPATNIAAAINHLNKYQRRTSIVFLISDFISPSYELELKNLSVRHDVVCVMLEDKLDVTLPQAGLVEFTDAENGQRVLLDTSSLQVRQKLNEMHNTRIEKWKGICKTAGADCIRISENSLRPLTQLMHQRAERLH